MTSAPSGDAPDGVPFDARAFWMPKAGQAEHEWEDAVAISTRRGRLAVADGASGAFDARRWARHVVVAWLDGVPEEAAFPAWHRAVASAHRRADPDDSSPWYELEAAERPSYCTLIGAAADGDRWRCTAIGDTTMFHLRQGELVSAWPVDSADGFDSTPTLLSSDPQERVTAQHHEFETRRHDTVVFATDAIAEWTLAHRDPMAAARLLAEIDQSGLRRLVRDLRHRDEIVNDDVTVVRCNAV